MSCHSVGLTMSKEVYQNPTAKRLRFDNGHGVVMIPMETLRHDAWAALSSTAKVVYIAMFTEFRRHSSKKSSYSNPDNLVKITQKQIQELVGLSHTTVVKGLFELRGYRQVKDVQVTNKSTNRKWVFDKTITDSKCFIFVRNQGGLEKNVTEYALNGYYLNSHE